MTINQKIKLHEFCFKLTGIEYHKLSMAEKEVIDKKFKEGKNAATN